MSDVSTAVGLVPTTTTTPVPPVSTDSTTLPPPPPPPVGNTELPAELGDPGKRAIDAMKAERNAAQAEARAAREALEALQATQMTDQERAIAEAKAAGVTEATAALTAQTNERLFKAAVQVAAATDIPLADGKAVRVADPSLLADPEVARRLLGFDEIPVTPEGDVDAGAISAAVAAFVVAKPNLAASATPAPGSADQGTRQSPPPKDLQTQIAEATAAEDWDLAGRLKLQQFAASPQP